MNVQTDITATDALEERRPELDARGIVFALARAKQELYADLGAVGFVERFGVDWNFMTLPTACGPTWTGPSTSTV